MQYELFYLVGERQESRLDEIKGGVNAFLTQEGATLVDEELMEKRKLSYEIKHQKKGTYITRRFDLPEIDYWSDESNSEKEFGIEAITKKLNLNSDVLRFLIVKTENLPALGAKERRKAQEMTAQRPESRGPQRPERRETPQSRPRPQQVAPVQKSEPEKKEAAKDIDKQLDELLNI
jgi:ribosomal protein S6